MGKKIFYISAVVSCLILLMVWTPPVKATSFDLTDPSLDFAAGNLGTSASKTKDGLTLTLSALTKIPDVSGLLSGGTTATGTVWIGTSEQGCENWIGEVQRGFLVVVEMRMKRYFSHFLRLFTLIQ
jgi:hypothetical protein